MAKQYKKKHFQRSNRDRNEREITAVLKAAQQEYHLLSPGDGADILLIMQPIAFLEIKNGANAKLTETEKALKWHCEIQGIEYHVIRTADEMVTVLNERQIRAELRKVMLSPERQAE